MLKWIVDRLEGRAGAVDSPIGLLPVAGELDLDGLGLTAEQCELLFSVDREVWREEAALIADHYATFGERLPLGLTHEREALVHRLG